MKPKKRSSCEVETTSCKLCGRTISSKDGRIEVCGPCIVERQS